MSAYSFHQDDDLQVTFLDIRQCFPGIEALADEGIEVLLKAQALEMGGEICHSSAQSVSSKARRGRAGKGSIGAKRLASCTMDGSIGWRLSHVETMLGLTWLSSIKHSVVARLEHGQSTSGLLGGYTLIGLGDITSHKSEFLVMDFLKMISRDNVVLRTLWFHAQFANLFGRCESCFIRLDSIDPDSDDNY